MVQPGGGSATATPFCAKHATYVNQGKLTIATDNPAFAPWFGGKASQPGSPWKANPNNGTGDPFSGEGFESAVAYAVAGKLGFAKVTRDRLMMRLGAAHPGYGFERHMGYSVPEHFEALIRMTDARSGGAAAARSGIRRGPETTCGSRNSR